ncbi:MAG: hypothetical protein ACI4RP_03985 [Acutalibacteraceae bacterium]
MQEFDFLLLTKVLSLILLLVNAILFIRGVSICSDRNKQFESGIVHTLYLPNMLFYLGAVPSLLLSTLCCILAFALDGNPAVLILDALALLCFVLVIAWKNCYITYDETGFTQKMFIGHKRYFTYDQITSYNGDFRNGNVNFYADGKRVFVSEYVIGRVRFFELIQEKYLSIHNGKTIPFSKSKLDIFNGHIKNPGEVIFSYIFGFILLIVVAIITVFNVFSISYCEENTEKHTLTFTSCEARDNDLQLFPSYGGSCYVIKDYKKYVKDIDSLKLNCDGKTEITVKAVFLHIPKFKPPYYLVCKLSNGDKIFYNFDDVNDFAKMHKFYIALLFLAFIILYITLVVLSIIVGRNPKKHPKLIRFIFKKGCILQ